MTGKSVDPNAANGVNPLNTLDFDINSLIPHNDFNWDTVEGIDSINNSIMKAYSNVAVDLNNRIERVEGKVASYDCAITDSLGRCIDNLSTNVDNIDAGIVDSLCKRADGLCEVYGNGSGSNQWWIIYRQCEDGKYHPFLESSSSYPTGYEAYGPFLDCSPFRIDIPKTMAVIPPKESSGPSADGDTLARVNGLYQEQLAYLKNVLYPGYQEGQGEDGSGMCGPLSDCNWTTTQPVTSCSERYYGATMPGREGCYEIWYPDTCDEVNVIAKEPDGTPFFKVVNDQTKHYGPWTKKEVCIDSPTTTIDIPVPIEQPVQTGSPTIIPVSQQQTLPINPPNSVVTTSPISNGVNPSVAVSSCPTPIIQNVVNVAPCQDANSNGSTQTISVEPTDLSQLINVIRDCCSKLTGTSESSVKGVASDVEYIYSESGQAKIDAVLLAQGLQSYDSRLPNTLGEALKDLSTLALLER